MSSPLRTAPDPYDDDAFTMPPRKRIALAAHPARHEALLAWARRNADLLSLHDVGAPVALAAALEEALDLPVRALVGGEPVVGPIAALLSDAAIDLLVVFCDSETRLSDEPALTDLLRRAVAWNVPFACNATTADFLVTSPLMLADYRRDVAVGDELALP